MLNFARRRAFLAVAALPFSAAVVNAQACRDAGTLTDGLTEPLASVRFLSDDALEGRLAGSDGERCAGDYIAARLGSLGLRGAGTDGSFFQDVPVPVPGGLSANPHTADAHAAVRGRNVVALLEGADAGLRDEMIVIGAHYDEIRDLQGFTDALAAHSPGDEVDIIVVREGREVRLRAVLGRRGG